MTFSFIVPTRNRKSLRDQMLASLLATTLDPANIEVIFIVDRDDTETIKELESKVIQYKEINVQFYVRNRSIFMQRDYYCWGAGFARGEFVWALGDDVLFQYKGWDTFIIQPINAFLRDKPDKIIMVGLKDNTPKPSNLENFPCFPIISKEAVKHLFFTPPQIPSWGADFVLFNLYKGLGRLLLINDHCFINHISYHTKQIPEDDIARRVGAIFNQLKMRKEFNTDRMLREDVPVWQEYLRSVIEGRIKL